MENFQSELLSETCQVLFRAWRQLCRGDALPRKEDLDPCQFKQILADVFLYQFDPVRRDFFIRLVGNNILLVRNGRYKPGQYLDELVPEETAMNARDIWCQVVQQPAAALSLLDGDQGRLSERVILPLQNEAGSLFVIGATHFHPTFVGQMDFDPVIKKTNRSLFLDLGKIPATA